MQAMQRLPCSPSRDGTKIYTRADRRVKSAASLAQMITTATPTMATPVPEDELNLAAYLNNTFYKFK